MPINLHIFRLKFVGIMAECVLGCGTRPSAFGGNVLQQVNQYLYGEHKLELMNGKF